MIKLCDAKELNCKHTNPLVMRVAVNFGGKLRSYCCSKCADDDIQECSDGNDSLERAIRGNDAFQLITKTIGV